MELIKTIRDEDVGVQIPPYSVQKERRAARAVVFDAEGRVALLHVTKKHFHKLPGGGVKQGESIEAGLRRELVEEIGCAVKNIRNLANIEEYRGKFKVHQVSYCFLADLNGPKGAPRFEADEIADGFVPVWMDLEAAIRTLEGEAPVEDYEGRFIQMRDLALLKEALRAVR